MAAAGYSSYLPLTESWADHPILVEGTEPPGDERTIFEYDLVTPGFFDAMGIELRQGRFLEDWDRENSPLVAVVNETAARMHFPNGEALGRRFSVGSGDQETWLTVVGVVEDVRHHHLTEEATPKFYIPFPQYPQPWPHGLNLVLRMSDIDWQTAAGMVREMINGMGVRGPLVEISPLEARVSQLVAGPRFNALVLTVFTSAALGLAVLGIYGLVAFGVAERRKEIGLKVALGAGNWRVQRETLWRGVRLTLIGIVFGFPLALGVGKIMASMLFGVAFYDPTVLMAAGLILTAASALACIVPSIRATGVDPVAALRIE
jgi:predicted permease